MADVKYRPMTNRQKRKLLEFGVELPPETTIDQACRVLNPLIVKRQKELKCEQDTRGEIMNEEQLEGSEPRNEDNPSIESRIPAPWFQAEPRNYTIHQGLFMRAKGMPFVIPPFQRGLVWTLEQKVRFVESIWAGLPLGSYVLNQVIGGPFERWLLDGQQRWNAIFSYVDGEFPVYGWLYADLSQPEHFRFKMRNFDCQETRWEDEAMLREVFERLAYGDTPNEGNPASIQRAEVPAKENSENETSGGESLPSEEA